MSAAGANGRSIYFGLCVCNGWRFQTLALPECCLSAALFGIDLEHCPQCGGTLKIIAAIEEPAVIVRILTHLGLPARAPPRAPARPLSLFQAA